MKDEQKSMIALVVAVGLVIWALLSVIVSFIDPLPKMAERARAPKVEYVTNATEQDLNRLARAWDDGFNAGEAALMFSTRYILTNADDTNRIAVGLSNLVQVRQFNPYKQRYP